ncbi:MAG: hypothetical protein JO284_17755 [Planctomycetaceae bacterium]|nr:hypothetical protein [Planctomycetaceae bacterium]
MSLAAAAVVSPDVAGALPRKRLRTSKATSRSCDPRPKKVSVYLSESAVRKLDIHVAMDGGDRSRLVEQLIQEGLRRYEMPRRRSEATVPVSEIDSDPIA